MLKIELCLPDELEAWLRRRSCGQSGDDGVRIAAAAVIATAFALEEASKREAGRRLQP